MYIVYAATKNIQITRVLPTATCHMYIESNQSSKYITAVIWSTVNSVKF